MSTLTELSTQVAAATTDHWDGPPFPFFLFPLFWLLALAVIATLIWTGRRRRDRTAGRRAGEQRLAERLADGSIDVQEYRARLAILRDK